MEIPSIRRVDQDLQERYQIRIDSLTKPVGSLGRLEETAARYAAIHHPKTGVGKKVIFTFAADHGVARRGVSLYPAEVTTQMVRNFLAGGAAISVLCRHYDIENRVVDMGVNHSFTPHADLIDRKIAKGTGDLLDGPAMSRRQAEESVSTGLALAQEAAAQGFDIIGTGEMGIGNTTASSAIFAALTAIDIDDLTGTGTGIDEETRRYKVDAIRQALSRNRPDSTDPLDVLAKVGGFEIGAIAGTILGGAASRLAVVVDGYISTAGALLAMQMAPATADYLFFSHCSFESGHRKVLDLLGVQPLLDLELRLGEGTGAALAIDLITAAVKMANEMATFDSAGVSHAGS